MAIGNAYIGKFLLMSSKYSACKYLCLDFFCMHELKLILYIKGYKAYFNGYINLYNVSHFTIQAFSTGQKYLKYHKFN